MNLLFALDEISDDLDGKGATSVGQTVLAAFADPDTYRDRADIPIAKMSVEYVLSSLTPSYGDLHELFAV